MDEFYISVSTLAISSETENRITTVRLRLEYVVRDSQKLHDNSIINVYETTSEKPSCVQASTAD